MDGASHVTVGADKGGHHRGDKAVALFGRV
jgi:hypothetical protein